MTDVGSARSVGSVGSGLRPGYAAARAHLGLVGVLLCLAAVGWWWTVQQMRGMDQGPWAGLGTFGWFISVWVVMMAAMMFPSVAPTVALYARMSRHRSLVWGFVLCYLATWTAAGVAAYVVELLVDLAGPDLQWDHAGRVLTGATLLAAAGYELTPLKNVCLGKCRSPLALLLGSWRDDWSGALRMGMRNGAWCVGCCWALMASLFALGMMSAVWMAVVAGLIALAKTLPWRRTATLGTAVLLLALGVLVLTAPRLLPGLTVSPPDPMSMMSPG